MITIIAGATAREAIRSRTFLGLLGVSLLAILSSRLIGWLSADGEALVTADVCLTLQEVMGVLVAVATGSVLVHREIAERTLATVLCRPLARWRFVVGKFLGLVLALLAGQTAMLVLTAANLALLHQAPSLNLLYAGLLTMELVVVMAAVSLCLTALAGPLLSAVLSLAVYLMGQAVHELPPLLGLFKGWRQDLVLVLAGLVPDLGSFGYRNQAVHGIPLRPEQLLCIPYGLLWILLLVTITVAVFRRKQL